MSRNSTAAARPDQLHLCVGYRSAPTAREAALIIDRVGNAWERTGREGRPAIEPLFLDRVEISSLHAWFELGAAVTAVADHRDMLIGFVQNIGVAVQTLTGANVGQVPASIRALLGAMATPVERGVADRASIQVHGDNNTIIIIDGNNAGNINSALMRRSDAGERVQRVEPATRRRRPAELTALPDVALKTGNGTTSDHATIVRFANEWYARPEGLGGVLLPANGSMLADAATTMQYTAHGMILPSRDRPREYHVALLQNPSVGTG